MDAYTRTARLASALDEVTPPLVAQGLRVLQGNRLAPTEAGHVLELARYMALPAGATVIDLGCGVGEVARILGHVRPDLRFVQVNVSPVQLAMAPEGERFTRILADFHNVPLGDACADVALFLYAICHGDQPRALREAARLVKPGGSLFIYDLAREGGDNTASEAELLARFHPVGAMVETASAAGWALDGIAQPVGQDDVLKGLFPDPARYAALFADLRPTIWRFTRRGRAHSVGAEPAVLTAAV